MLSRNGILEALNKGDIRISPFNEKQLGPNSYDVRLGNKIAYYVLVGETMDYPTVTYGLVNKDSTPELYGHLAVLDATSENAGHIIRRPVMDLAGRPPIIQREIPEDGFVLYPGNVYLAHIKETICGIKYVPELTGRSSLARAGVGVEVSAPYANVGDELKYTVEITVVYPTIIYPDMKIAQIFFHQLEDSFDPNLNRYTGKYSSDRFHDENLIVSYIPDEDLEAHMFRIYKAQARINEEKLINSAKDMENNVQPGEIQIVPDESENTEIKIPKNEPEINEYGDKEDIFGNASLVDIIVDETLDAADETSEPISESDNEN